MAKAKAADATREREDDREEQEEERIERQPMGGHSQSLKVSGLPKDMVPRWFNHKGNRIREARAAGYQAVLDDGSLGPVKVSGDTDSEMEQWVRMRVGTNDGAPLYAYLMAIRKEWYDEDQAKKMQALDDTDKAIQGNPFPQGNPDENTYVKQADIQQNVPLKR